MTNQEDRNDGTSRRTFLKATAATGAMVGVGGVGATQEQRIELNGAIGGWIGQAPEEIADQQNPTLELQAGQTYVLEWENGDGFRHNFVIIDANGNQVVRTEITSEQGETQTVEFEATEDMVEYFCEIHPGTMRGDIQVAEREEIQPSQEEDIAPQGPEVGLQTVAEGLTAPLSFETAPGVDGQYFVVDQTGQIYVIDAEDGLQEEPFLDVSNQMVDLGIEELNGYDERGLLGLAFHPDFQENRRFYVRYSAPFRGGLGQETTEEALGIEGDATPTDGTPTDGTPTEAGTPGNETTTPGGTPTDAGTETPTESEMAFQDGTETPTDGTPTGTPDAEETPGEETPTDGTVTPGGKTGGPAGEWDHTDVLAEYQANEDLTSADSESERVIMEIASPQDNHNGGALAFGPDGYLYSSIGDGGDADDTGFGHVDDWYDENEGGNGQDVEANPLGSILRIDVDAEETNGTETPQDGTETPQEGGENGQAYAIPEDNPLDPEQYDYPEQWAWGFRNPWRMSFNDGELFVGDAGQNLWEEVDVVENGGNYGWNVKEGTHCFSTADASQSLAQCPNAAPDEEPYNGQELQDPIIEYPHRQATIAFIDGSVVIGGYTYQGDAVPELQGTYLFGNWSAQGVVNPEGEIFAASPPDDGAGTPTGETPTEAGTPTDGTPTGTPDGETPTGETPTGETPTDGTPTESELAFQDGTETPTGTPGETPTDGTPTDGQQVEDAPAAQTGPQGQYGGTWSFEELVVSGAPEGRLDRYVYAFGRDQDGELYVCTNQEFRPEGETGVVYRIVPSGEGDLTPADGTETPTDGTPTGTPEDGTPTGETPADETPTNGTPEETPGTETDTPTESDA